MAGDPTVHAIQSAKWASQGRPHHSVGHTARHRVRLPLEGLTGVTHDVGVPISRIAARFAAVRCIDRQLCLTLCRAISTRTACVGGREISDGDGSKTLAHGWS